MKNQISKEVVKIIQEKKNNFQNENFEKALKMYKDLIDQGLTKPRGYQLLSTEEKYKSKIAFNQKKH